MTNHANCGETFALCIRMLVVKKFKVIAFTHKSTALDNLSRFFIEENQQVERLMYIKTATGVEEICYLATCNRIEFFISTDNPLQNTFLHSFFKAFNGEWSNEDIAWNIQHAQLFEGEDALNHILHVASSLDSLVVGEREIITQVRNAYELAQKAGLTGEMLRLVMKATVKTAKEVFTHTKIAEKSVSVVFLAYQMLRNLNIKLDARILIIGAGQTNGTMAKYLLKHGFTNFTVFNRTLERAEMLAGELRGEAYSLAELANHNAGFDVLISCTGAADAIVTQSLYQQIIGEDTTKKVLLDLAIPNDIDKEIKSQFNSHYIEISDLKTIADNNLQDRHKELEEAMVIVNQNIVDFKLDLQHRKVELAMQEVPRQIKEIKNMAVSSVFAKEIEQLDEQSREVLDKVLSYMEKKYISVPMVLAKDILIGQR